MKLFNWFRSKPPGPDLAACTESRCEEPTYDGICALCRADAERTRPAPKTVQQRMLDSLTTGPDDLFKSCNIPGETTMNFDGLRLHAESDNQITVTLQWKGNDTWSMKPLYCRFDKGDSLTLHKLIGTVQMKMDT